MCTVCMYGITYVCHVYIHVCMHVDVCMCTACVYGTTYVCNVYMLSMFCIFFVYSLFVCCFVNVDLRIRRLTLYFVRAGQFYIRDSKNA